jgi:hypothetical protein
MRIAAGVLLIILSLISACSGFAYGLGGAVASQAGEVGNELNGTPILNDKGEKTDEIKISEDTQKNLENISAMGGGLAIFGIFLLVMFALEIAAAVCLFTQKASTFVLVVSVLALLAEAGGFYFLGTAGIAFKIFGIVTAALAIVASRSYGRAQEA